MACKVIQAAEVAMKFTEEIRQAVIQISQKGPTPKLVGFLANSDPAAKSYANWTAKACEEVGIHFELRQVERTVLEDHIMQANKDNQIHGIMVYYPVFGHAQDQYLQNCVISTKDVEGLSHLYRYNMYHNIRFLDPEKKKKCILPCTPLAIVKILEHLHLYNPLLPNGALYGKQIVIINRSEVVGRPLAALLANDGAKVYSIDINDILEMHRGQGLTHQHHVVSETSITLEEALNKADIVITGVPSPDYQVNATFLKEGVVAINFSSSPNFNLESIRSKAAFYVPSIGKVTVAMLQRNLIRLYENQLS